MGNYRVDRMLISADVSVRVLWGSRSPGLRRKNWLFFHDWKIDGKPVPEAEVPGWIPEYISPEMSRKSDQWAAPASDELIAALLKYSQSEKLERHGGGITAKFKAETYVEKVITTDPIITNLFDLCDFLGVDVGKSPYRSLRPLLTLARKSWDLNVGILCHNESLTVWGDEDSPILDRADEINASCYEVHIYTSYDTHECVDVPVEEKWMFPFSGNAFIADARDVAAFVEAEMAFYRSVDKEENGDELL